MPRPTPAHPQKEAALARIELDDRLVVLARTIDAPTPEAQAALAAAAADRAHLGETCLGQALYRHRSVFRNASDAPVWSHLELGYFRGVVPADVVRERVAERQPAGIRLLRAEILLTTPASFIQPRDWQGCAARPELQASLEYIDVGPAHLGEYRDFMRKYCGPAAAQLVLTKRVGTFRAMETSAVLHRDPDMKVEWNQIHLCEVDPGRFEGFGKAFDTALREITPGSADFTGVFAGLDRIRTLPRWTLNDAVVEADAALGREGTAN